jgi:protein-tyrosine phosphatase
MVVSRNRYGNVQPWAESRIKLKVPIDGSDYVNASPINLKSRSASATPNGQSTTSLNQQTTSTSIDLPESSYIASQGPKDGQFSHFWNMIMQETLGDVGVIVMLTQCWEGNKEKCGQYFPASMDMPTLDLELSEGHDQPSSPTGDPFLDSDPLTPDADSDPTEDPVSRRNTPEVYDELDKRGSITLLEIFHDTKSRSEVRKMTLQIGDETKTIWHYLFNGWPDYGKPEGEDRRALLELIKQSAEKAGDPRRNSRCVHCSAGVGRTGTFIALDYLLRELAHGKLEVIPSRPSSSGQHTQGSQEGSDAESTNGSFVMGKESTPEAKEDLVFETVNTLREQRMMMVMNDVQFSFLYEVLRDAYIETYSPVRGKVVGSDVGIAGESAKQLESSGVLSADADTGEPSPKMARMDHMLFVGPTETAPQEEKKEVERKAANAEAVTANSISVQGDADKGDPYAAADPDVVR